MLSPKNETPKRWEDMTREERSKRLGDPSRWEAPATASNARDAELLRRLDAGEYLTTADAKEARSLRETRASLSSGDR